MRAVHSSYRLYLHSMYFLQCIADYNLRDYEQRRHKNLPTEEDLKTNLRLYENPIFQFLRSNEPYQKLLKKEYITGLVDMDFVRILYKKFAQTEYFQTYSQMARCPVSEHQYCIVNLYKFLLQEELFIDHIDHHFPLWEEDLSLLYGAIKNTVRQLPEKADFYEEFVPNEEFVQEFGKRLLYDFCRSEKELQPLVAEKLQNWQEDRIALMDTIIIKLALCELLYHPSIPTKVTIDEYVGIAKEYSTDKSKRFINGILDRLMRQLQDEGKIQKTGRGLVE